MRNTLINYRQHTEAIKPVNEKRRKTKMTNHKEDPAICLNCTKKGCTGYCKLIKSKF